jgi:IPT/TIG domain-containing protein
MRSLLAIGVLGVSIASADPKPAQPVAVPKLSVTSIDPPNGDADGGTYVRITGTRFIADGARNAKVYFGSRQGTVVRFSSDTELIVEAPGGKPDETVDVLLIFAPGGEIKLPKAFTFVVLKRP